MGSSPEPRVSAEDYVSIRDFYARQMHLIDAFKLEDYAATFTADGGVDHAHRGLRVMGREAQLAFMRAALPRYKGVVVRHWFDHLLIEPTADGWRVSYYSLVTRTDDTGHVSFEPTFTVEDDLVRGEDGGILTRLRVIHQDRPTAGPTD
jgi:actinorhodin biosynthesis protein ActVIA